MREEWHPSQPLPESSLDDLYYFMEQSDRQSAATKETPDHTYNWNLFDYPEPWEVEAPVLSAKHKKNIIVSNYILAADPEGGKESIVLLLELAQQGFSLYVLTQENRIEKIDPKKIREDISYLKSLCARSHLLHAQAMRSKLAKSKHPKNPITFSDETCFILDHYQTEKIKHAWQDKEGSPFNYRVKVEAASLLDSKPLGDHVQWNMSHLILEHADPYASYAKSLNDLFPGLKKLSLVSRLGNSLEYLPEDLEELCLDIQIGDMDLSRFKKLRHLTLNDFAEGNWKGDLPSQLQTLKIVGELNITNPYGTFPNFSACQQLKKIEIINCPNHVVVSKILNPLYSSMLDSPPPHPIEICFEGDKCSSLSNIFLSDLFSLTRFKFHSRYQDDPSYVLNPTKITNLDIGNAKTEDVILNNALKKVRFVDVTTIPALPDTLEGLVIQECSLEKISLPSHLKSASLIRITIPIVIDVSKAWQLEYLQITGSVVKSIEGFTVLSRLHTLYLDCKNLPWFNNLPSSLKHLVLIDAPLFPSSKGKHDLPPLEDDETPIATKDFSNLHLERFELLHYKQSSHLPIVLPKTITYLKLDGSSITSLDLRAYTQLRYVYLENNKHLTSVQLPVGIISFINRDNPKIDIQVPDTLLPELKNDDSHLQKKRESHAFEQLERVSNFSGSIPATATDYKRGSTRSAPHTDDLVQTKHSLARDTYTDSKNESVEVRYKIYGMVNGCRTELPANTYRKEVCDGIGWNENEGLTVSTSAFQDLIKVSCPQKDLYTTEDLAWLKPDERFVKRPLEVKSTGIHRIFLDTLSPYDELIDIVLAPQSTLLFNKSLNSYVLEWETNGSQKATVQYRFREASSPPETKHASGLKRRQAPPLDKSLRKHLETLFLTKTHSKNAPEAFLRLKEKLSKVFKEGEAEKLAFCRKELAEYCTAFENVPLKEKKGWKKLEEILVEAKGACHDQSMVFVMLCHFLGVEARYIGNDIHAFVELRNAQGIWETLQLGGHETQLKYTDQPLDLPKPTYPPPLPREMVVHRERGSYKLNDVKEEACNGIQLDEKHSPTSHPTPHIRKDWKPYFASQHKEKKYENLSAVLDDLHRTSNPLVTVADTTAAQQLYAAMANHLAESKDKKPILYIESPSDLHAFWKVCHIPEGDDDSDEAENAPLREIIEKGGTVMINWERFNATQMDSYKTLMDDPPSFKGVIIAADVLKDVHFIHMITPKTQGSGAFLSRTNKFKGPAQHVIPAQPVIPARMPGPRSQGRESFASCELDPGIHAGTTEKKRRGGMTESDSGTMERTTEKKHDETTRRIDLYGSSSHWETQLVGTILPSDQGFTFNSGTLTEIAKTPSSEPVHVELVDPPKDPRFQAFMTRLSVNHGFIANGRSRTLPEQFSVSDAPAPEVKTPTQLAQVPAATWNPDELPQNVFVLNSSRLPHLFQEQALKETKEKGVYNISTEAGWLPPPQLHEGEGVGKESLREVFMTPSPYPLPPLRGGEGVRKDEKKSTRQIIQTAPISDGERRRILDAIAAQDETIEWVDLSQSIYPLPLPHAVVGEGRERGSYQLREATLADIPTKNAIIQTPDPEFVTQGLVEDAKDKDNIVSIPIYSTTTSSELLESIDLFTLSDGADAPPQGEREGDESKKPFALRRRVSAVAKGERLAESDVKEQKSHTKKPPQFSCKTQPMLQALREGKTVILHGQLSAQVYESLQTLFLPNPYLTLSTFPYTQPIKGRLIVLSDTLPQATVLAQRTQSQTYLPQEALWEAYQSRLEKDHKASPDVIPSEARDLDTHCHIHEIPRFARDDNRGTRDDNGGALDDTGTRNDNGAQDDSKTRDDTRGITENFNRLKSLYALANQYSSEQPPFISYEVLCQCLEALAKNPTEDNPIKPWFQNEEQGSTNYAQLNVLAKLFVGPDTPPTVRTEKLKRYSLQEEDDVWRRLNCLNPSALRQVMFGKKNPSEKDYASLKVMDNKTLRSRLNSWLKTEEYKPRKSNPDPHAKVMARMRKHLQEKNAVVLKGPPGSGKTWAAYQYADEVGSPPFLANDPGAIEKWKKHQPGSGEKAVLIVDEANLKRAGYWESLAAHISATHQVIFTRNPNSYGGRVPHRILQTIPTVTVKKWTSEGLLQHILVPLCKHAPPSSRQGCQDPDHTDVKVSVVKVSVAEKKVTADEMRVLRGLVTVYEFVKDHSPKDSLSIRDLQQLTLRWLQHPQKETDPEQAAYDACWQEWGLGFKQTDLRNAFIQILRSLREVYMTPSPYPLPPLRGGEGMGRRPPTNPRYQQALASWPADFHLMEPQRHVLAVMSEDLHLHERCLKLNLKGSDGAPLSKSGFLLEGPSGFGKSKLIRNFLKSTDHLPIEPDELKKNPDANFSNRFLHFTLSNPKDDKELLRLAFRTGCKVILDELNLAPLIEEELNHLLTGKTREGEVAKHDGFFVFATQNGEEMAGRKSVSSALLNRFHMVHTPNYSAHDLLPVVTKALPHFAVEDQKDIVSDYLDAAQEDPEGVNPRKLHSGLKEIGKDYPAPQVVSPSPITRHPGIDAGQTDIPNPFALRRRASAVSKGEQFGITEKDTNLSRPYGLGPVIPDGMTWGNERSDEQESTVPPSRRRSRASSGRTESEMMGGFFSQPKKPPPYLNPKVYVPFLFSMAIFSMSGVSFAAAYDANLKGMLARYPDFAHKNVENIMKQGELIAIGMVIAAVILLVGSSQLYKRVKEENTRLAADLVH